MNEKQEEIGENDIATSIKVDNSTSDFEVVINYLIDLKLIKDHGNLNYMITPEGSRFNSFEEFEEEKSLPIKLAKSNIEANKFQKQMAIKNEKKEKLNRQLMRINIAVGIVIFVFTLIQVWLLLSNK